MNSISQATRRTFGALALVLVLALPLALPGPALAANASPTGAVLPTGTAWASAVHANDGQVYILGGRDANGYTDAILTYDPSQDVATTTSYVLPSARSNAGAFSDGAGNIYVLGGRTPSGPLDQIVRYTPATGDMTVLTEHLPIPVFRAAVVWTGTYAYVFGGATATGSTDQILRYDPAAGTVTTLATTLPEPTYGMGAGWDASTETAYLVGGRTPSCFSRAILTFDPATETVADTGVLLPRAGGGPCGGRFDAGTAVLENDRALHIFGGYAGGYCYEAFPNEVLRLDLQNHVLKKVATMPSGRTGVAVTPTGSASVHAFGGENCGTYYKDVLVTTHCPNQAPSAPIPSADGMGNGTLGWANYPYAFSASQSTDPDGDPVSYRWKFGDQATGDTRNATHLYKSTGTYTVTVTAIDDPSAREGCALYDRTPSSSTLTFIVIPDWTPTLQQPADSWSCAANVRVWTWLVHAHAVYCHVEAHPDTNGGPTSLVDRAVFRVDQTPFAEDWTPPYEAEYDSFDYDTGRHSLDACFNAKGDKHTRLFCSEPYRFWNVGIG